MLYNVLFMIWSSGNHLVRTTWQTCSSTYTVEAGGCPVCQDAWVFAMAEEAQCLGIGRLPTADGHCLGVGLPGSPRSVCSLLRPVWVPCQSLAAAGAGGLGLLVAEDQI